MKQLKYCRYCNKNKDFTFFTKNNFNKDLLSNKCKKCKKFNVKLIDVNKLNTFHCIKCCCVKDKSLFYRVKLPNVCIDCAEETFKNDKKSCNKCKKLKKYSEFTRDINSKDFINNTCKSCTINSLKEYTHSVLEKKCALCKTVLQSNEFVKNKRVKDGLSYYCKKCANINSKKYDKNKDQNKKRLKNRLAKEPIFKLSANTRNIIWQSFKRACNGTYKKSDKTENILGCTIPKFIEHLQSLFTEGMTLENNGNCEECWHIDHKIPLASAVTEEDIIKLCHYTNLQPLWSRENIKKGKN